MEAVHGGWKRTKLLSTGKQAFVRIPDEKSVSRFLDFYFLLCVC